MTDRTHWVKRLTEGIRGQRADYAHNLSLPAGLGFVGRGEEVEIIVDAETISTANMQDDTGAFEAWALALKTWGGAQRVRLTTPVTFQATVHAWQFRYRVGNFVSLFPDWFSLTNPVPTAMEPGVDYVLNVESAPRVAPVPLPVPSSAAREHDLELLLAHHPEISANFCRALGLRHVGRQLPVGIFAGTVSQETERSPRQKSAIDLWGLGEGPDLSIIELKKGDNDPLGIVSELLFYVSVMRDLQRGQLRFDDGRDQGRFREIPGTKRIVGWLLAPKLHTMLEGPLSPILDLLNSGFEKRGEQIRMRRARLGTAPAFDVTPF